jgi:fluoroacetyl-CoA thioesterase
MRPIPATTEAKLNILVTPEMTVHFDELGPLHPVYATYQIARHFEEAGRKLLLPYLEDGEEGVGSAVSVEHHAPAVPGMNVEITATLDRVEGRRLHVRAQAVSDLGDLIASGQTTQVVMRAEQLRERFAELERRLAQHRQQQEKQDDH